MYICKEGGACIEIGDFGALRDHLLDIQDTRCKHIRWVHLNHSSSGAHADQGIKGVWWCNNCHKKGCNDNNGKFFSEEDLVVHLQTIHGHNISCKPY